MNVPAGSVLSDATSRFLATPRMMLIGGEWREAVSGARIDVRDLYTVTKSVMMMN